MQVIPRNHYLLLHDALRKVIAESGCPAPPRLAAFVQRKHRYQCDMVLNCVATDPVGFGLGVSGNGNYHGFVHALQRQLGMCRVLPGPHPGRVDVQFRDQVVVKVALGAAWEDLPVPQEVWSSSTTEQGPGSAAAKEGDAPQRASVAQWLNTGGGVALTARERARVRLSLGGFDEALFTASCTAMEKRAARQLWEWTREYSQRRPVVFDSHPAVAAGNGSPLPPFEQLLPPQYYWLAHAHEAAEHYGALPTSPGVPADAESSFNNSSPSTVRHHVDLIRVVRQSCMEDFSVAPLENPFFPGEDLNVMPEAVWWCMLFQSPMRAAQIGRMQMERQAALKGATSRSFTAAADSSCAKDE